MYSLRRISRALQAIFNGDPAQRRRVRQELARISASLFGDFPIAEDHKLWRTDREFLSHYKRLSPYNPYSEERKFTLRELVRYTNPLPGCLAECGCYQGASAWFMASESLGTPIYLFDSFQGLSKPTDRDRPPSQSMPGWQAGDMTANEAELRSNLRDFEHIHIMKGWIPDRFKEVGDIRFRFVHVDVDLYQPTLDSLDFFYPRMTKGGVILLDDYGFTNCPGAYSATQEYVRDSGIRIIHLPTGQGIIMKE